MAEDEGEEEKEKEKEEEGRQGKRETGKGREGASRWSKLVGGNRQTHSQPERTSTFPVMRGHPVYLILPKRLDRDIPQRGKGRGRRED